METRVTRSLLARSLMVLLPCWAAVQGSAEAHAVCDKSTTQVRLQVKVSGAAVAKGEMAITVYADDKKRFLAKGGKLLRQRLPVRLPLTTACFVLPKADFYAVAVYHDINADQDFNRSFVGMPTEGFGFSRNPKTRLGLPSLTEVRVVTVLGDNIADIKLTYP